ncbi:hypothetical protein K493DRAFT_10955 [Basidiobolus meristosporus CBS 931.73]|uniref:Uncharacterized protein n=1 Tax=Basidiobolus meristosporus CBS 931.73 TaxID=1314790 RepID=A0A1Y1VSZ7_9FUNG|nr:hypothetical protein K493DRAFT_10955 [Basidiobolus meristosporus CBS 931.73]|eukprot:ORX64155.1 hypothetical protein K493DRAFT_10955 [Basidiobolus meristosporus CBS 931.73]
MTTYEQLRSSVNIQEASHSFSLGNILTNICRFVARPSPPSYIDWHKVFQERQSNSRPSPRVLAQLYEPIEPH